MSGPVRLGRDGRAAGALYLLVVLAGMFCLAWVPSQLGAAADAAARPGLFRAGIAAFLVMQVAFLLLPFALYRVLGDVDRGIATVMVVLAVVAVPIGMVAAMHQLDALASLAPRTDTMVPGVSFAEAMQDSGRALRIASLFWGLWLLPFGWLVLRSARVPRVLGLLLVLGGIGYVANVFGGLWPGYSASGVADYIRLPAALGEIGSCLWLLLFGARTGGTRSAAAGGK